MDQYDHAFVHCYYIAPSLCPAVPSHSMDSPSRAMHIETSFLRDGLARVVFIFPGGTTPTTMLVSFQDLNEALESLREAGRNDATEHPIPESMLAECAPQAGDTCSICLEEEVASPPCGPASPPWVSLLRCQHRFHAHCIRRWPRSVCPNCRQGYADV